MLAVFDYYYRTYSPPDCKNVIANINNYASPSFHSVFPVQLIVLNLKLGIGICSVDLGLLNCSYIEHSLIEPFLNLYKFALQTVYIIRSDDKLLAILLPQKLKVFSSIRHFFRQTDLNFPPVKCSVMLSEMEVRA